MTRGRLATSVLASATPPPPRYFVRVVTHTRFYQTKAGTNQKGWGGRTTLQHLRVDASRQAGARGFFLSAHPCI